MKFEFQKFKNLKTVWIQNILEWRKKQSMNLRIFKFDPIVILI